VLPDDVDPLELPEEVERFWVVDPLSVLGEEVDPLLLPDDVEPLVLPDDVIPLELPDEDESVFPDDVDPLELPDEGVFPEEVERF